MPWQALLGSLLVAFAILAVFFALVGALLVLLGRRRRRRGQCR